jgi:hypothetical protein
MEHKTKDLIAVILLGLTVLILISIVFFNFKPTNKINSIDENLFQEDYNPIICDNSCFNSKAINNQDESLCFNIEDENIMLACTYSIKKTQILERTVFADDIDLCNNFEEAEEIAFCNDNYYIAKRFNENDLSYCSNIVDEVIKNECLK